MMHSWFHYQKYHISWLQTNNIVLCLCLCSNTTLDQRTRSDWILNFYLTLSFDHFTPSECGYVCQQISVFMPPNLANMPGWNFQFNSNYYNHHYYMCKKDKRNKIHSHIDICIFPHVFLKILLSLSRQRKASTKEQELSPWLVLLELF